MTSKGKVVGKLPPRGNANSTWDEVVHTAQQHPNEAVLADADLAMTMINSVRQYVDRGRKPYVTDEGHILVSCRNSHRPLGGKRRGDMYFTWIPNGSKEA